MEREYKIGDVFLKQEWNYNELYSSELIYDDLTENVPEDYVYIGNLYSYIDELKSHPQEMEYKTS